MTVEVGAFDMTVPKSSLEIGFVYNNMGQGSDPGWEGWNPAWTKRKGGARTHAVYGQPWTNAERNAYHAEQAVRREQANAARAAYNLLPKLPQSPNMTVEVGAFDLTVPKGSLTPGTPYTGMGQGRDPGWVGWNPAWSRSENEEASVASSSNNEDIESVASAEEAEAAEAEAESVSAENNNDSTAEEERAENAGVNSFLSGGSRRRRSSRKNRR
jgi:hypothetical protein